MIRIVGVQRNTQPDKEFVLLQNQGSLRLNLRGHILASDEAFQTSNLTAASHAFGDDALIPPGMYVILYSGVGAPRWTKTKEGQMVYYTYMGRGHSVWEYAPGSVHILSTQHTYVEKPPALLLR